MFVSNEAKQTNDAVVMSRSMRFDVMKRSNNAMIADICQWTYHDFFMLQITFDILQNILLDYSIN